MARNKSPRKRKPSRSGSSPAAMRNWKSRYGGMEASDIKKIKDLEENVARLRRERRCYAASGLFMN